LKRRRRARDERQRDQSCVRKETDRSLSQMYEEERRERNEVRASAFKTRITSSGFPCSIRFREYLNQRIWLRHASALVAYLINPFRLTSSGQEMITLFPLAIFHY
jgi:hypothetical protein